MQEIDHELYVTKKVHEKAMMVQRYIFQIENSDFQEYNELLRSTMGSVLTCNQS